MHGVFAHNVQNLNFGCVDFTAQSTMKRSGRKNDNDNDNDDDDDDVREKLDAKSLRSSVSRANLQASPHELDTRRAMKWVSFTRPKSVLGFEHLSPAYVPAMTDRPRGIAVVLENVSGWRMPKSIKTATKGNIQATRSSRSFTYDENSEDEDDFELSVQLSMSLFHLATGAFFGSTWFGRPLNPTTDDERAKTCDFDCGDIVYLLSRITDAACIAIVEIVVTKLHSRSRLALDQYGCGWTILNLFAGDLRDLSESSGSAQEFTKVLFLSIYS